jgi:hypothetical protein
MKLFVAILLLIVGVNAAQLPEPMCRTRVCNRIERFSLDLWSHIKDRAGETCFEIHIPKSEAVVGKVLDSDSRWYQGSHFNPTKKSVTKIKAVYECN